MRFKNIIRFNWPYYAAAGLALAVIPVVLSHLSLPAAMRIAAYVSLALMAGWLVTSIVVSWIVYSSPERVTVTE